MDPAGYRGFTAALLERAASDPDVFSLVAQSLMAEAPHPPGCFSDHDFFLIVRPGVEDQARAGAGLSRWRSSSEST